MAELPLTMPKMSMTMEEGTLVSWLKSEGDAVRAGEPICEVATDKVDMEVESPFDGTLARIIAQPDDVYAVGDTIGFITTDADDLLGGLFDEPEAPTETVAVAEVEAPVETTDAQPTASGWVASVPAARTLAADTGIDLHEVSPTGPGGTVRVGDVEAAARAVEQSPVVEPVETPMPPSAAAEPAEPTVTAAEVIAPVPVEQPAPSAAAPGAAPTPHPAPAQKLDPTESRRRRTRMQVAKVMSVSATVPQFTAFIDLDLSALAAVRKTTLEGASWTAILVRAQAIALAETPALNGTWSDDGVVPNEHIGIALAIDSPTGLLAPVLRNPHEGSLADVVAEIADTVEATRTGTLPPARLGGGTSVFSNLGGFGVDSFNALLTPPQSTALSSGAVKQRIRVFDDGSFGARLSCTIGLTVDHRVADGADAARMLATIRDVLSEPERIR